MIPPRKRVGVLTFHRPINYGSYWQARCLVEELTRRGYAAEIIDHDDPATRRAEYRLSLRPTLPTPVSREDRAAYARKIRSFLSPVAALPLSAPACLGRLKELPAYDAVVIGSDEVWNSRHPLYAGRAAFFGVGLPARRVVSYAASFGNTSCWEGLAPPWPELVASLDAISVRDENSWWMLKHALGVEAPLVLDPCLLADPAGPSAVAPEGRYALVYGHNFSAPFADAVREWGRTRGVRLVSMGYRNDWADESLIAAGPIEFDAAVAGAEAVATNFFHGCVFALRYGKPFATETTPYRQIKVRDLMIAIGGEEHLGGVGALDTQPSSAVMRRLSELRTASHAYLDGALP